MGKAEAPLEELRARAARVETVALLHPVDRVHEVAVHPKGAEAIMRVMAQDDFLGDLVARRTAVAVHEDPADAALLARVDAILTAELQRLAWWLSHPGPALPAGDPPPWAAGLDQIDLHRIVAAHQTVNGPRIQALQEVLGMGWSGAPRPPRAPDAASPARAAEELRALLEWAERHRTPAATSPASPTPPDTMQQLATLLAGILQHQTPEAPRGRP